MNPYDSPGHYEADTAALALAGYADIRSGILAGLSDDDVVALSLAYADLLDARHRAPEYHTRVLMRFRTTCDHIGIRWSALEGSAFRAQAFADDRGFSHKRLATFREAVMIADQLPRVRP